MVPLDWSAVAWRLNVCFAPILTRRAIGLYFNLGICGVKLGICGGAANEDECSQRNPLNSKSLVLHGYLVWIVAGFPTNTTADDRIVIEITENKSGLWAQAS
jgi:hypothetical protein